MCVSGKSRSVEVPGFAGVSSSASNPRRVTCTDGQWRTLSTTDRRNLSVVKGCVSFVVSCLIVFAQGTPPPVQRVRERLPDMTEHGEQWVYVAKFATLPNSLPIRNRHEICDEVQSATGAIPHVNVFLEKSLQP